MKRTKAQSRFIRLDPSISPRIVKISGKRSPPECQKGLNAYHSSIMYQLSKARHLFAPLQIWLLTGNSDMAQATTRLGWQKHTILKPKYAIRERPALPIQGLSQAVHP